MVNKSSINAKIVTQYRKRLKFKTLSILGGRCSICGYNKCVRALTFHHVDPATKRYTLASYAFLSTAEFLEEAKKCVVLCANCHAEVEDGLVSSPCISSVNMQALEEAKQQFLANHPDKKQVYQRICPCCHVNFETSCKSQINCSYKCARKSRRKVQRPSREDLEKMLWEIPTTAIARIFGVSDTAVSKWAKIYNLPKPPRGYWSIG